MKPTLDGFVPSWSAPSAVRAFVTARTGGFGQGAFSSFNLAHHVGDDPEAVAANRALLRNGLELPAEPAWLDQAHGHSWAVAGPEGPVLKQADAAVVTSPDAVAAVLTADCLPLLLARGDGTGAAAIHAGWRGLAEGVIEAAANALGSLRELHAYLGPAIGPAAYTVGDGMRSAFVDRIPGDLAAFSATTSGWKADLYQLARNRLLRLGVPAQRIAGGDFCTLTERDRFFSYRRDGQTGRIATLVWLEGTRPAGG